MQYWVDKFAAHGYTADRSVVENIPGISSWFVENLVVFQKS